MYLFILFTCPQPLSPQVFYMLRDIYINNKQYIMRAIRAADLARLEHARMHEALRN